MPLALPHRLGQVGAPSGGKTPFVPRPPASQEWGLGLLVPHPGQLGGGTNSGGQISVQGGAEHHLVIQLECYWSG